MQSDTQNSAKSKILIRKAVYLQYALGFIVTMMVVSAFNTWIAKHILPNQVYVFWKWVGGPTALFAAGLSVKSALAAKYPEGNWGKKVGRFFSFSCLLGGIASLLPVYFPATEAAFQPALHGLDVFISKGLDPPPPPRQPPKEIKVADAYAERWFDPLHWYVRDRNGNPRFFISVHEGDQDPHTGTVLTPITNGIVYEAQQRQDEAKRLQEFRSRLTGRQQKARDAQKALDSANYELALENCPGVAAEFRPDPCEHVYHEAAGRKVSALVKRSKQEILEDKLGEAIHDAQLALRVDPGNQAAMEVLALAQRLERQ